MKLDEGFAEVYDSWFKIDLPAWAKSRGYPCARVLYQYVPSGRYAAFWFYDEFPGRPKLTVCLPESCTIGNKFEHLVESLDFYIEAMGKLITDSQRAQYQAREIPKNHRRVIRPTTKAGRERAGQV